MAGAAPGGLSWDEFKSISVDLGDWVWGTVQGAFNEKATTSQILVDAVVGMIPFVGDVTGVRDLLAVVIGLATDPRKREEKMQWILLVVLLFALIPVVGGIIKGVGRLLLKAMGEVAHLAAGAQRAAHMAQAAKDIIAFLNRVGVGNAEKFLAELKFADHQTDLISKLVELVETLSTALKRAKAHVGSWVPARFVATIDSLLAGLSWVKEAAPQRIKEAIKELDAFLRELQTYVRSGGETTSHAVTHTVETGGKEVQRTDELILLEGKGATRSARGGLKANSPARETVGEFYTREAGFPDLGWVAPGKPPPKDYYRVATYTGKIDNEMLREGRKIYRFFGKTDKTFGFPVDETFAAGRVLREGVPPSFWGLGEVPTTAKEWRKNAAVLDEWNADGFVLVGTVMNGHQLPACTGIIAEQTGQKIGSQYLPGGGQQAMLQLPRDVAERVNDVGEALKAGKHVAPFEFGGVRWELRPTGWDDASGVYGYLNMPGPGSVQTARLGATTLAEKRAE